jgi:hypothetical protein
VCAALCSQSILSTPIAFDAIFKLLEGAPPAPTNTGIARFNAFDKIVRGLFLHKPAETAAAFAAAKGARLSTLFQRLAYDSVFHLIQSMCWRDERHPETLVDATV